MHWRFAHDGLGIGTEDWRKTMMRKIIAGTALGLLLILSPVAKAGTAELVVLLHGLTRSADSMARMADSLTAAGFEVCNVDYPSTKSPIESLAAGEVLSAIQACIGAAPRKVSFVSHSMGGILVRQLKASARQLDFGRVVMLGPPNGGSEVVDKLGGLPPFAWINGPAGLQLGTGQGSVPQALGATDLDVGIIAGRHSVNLVLSLLIPGDDDGKVSIESAKLEGMRDFLVVPVSHPFLMKDKEVIRQTIRFLQAGAFDHGRQVTAADGPL